MNEPNELREFAIYLLARSKTYGEVRNALLKRFGVALDNKQLATLASESVQAISELAEDLPRQLKLAHKYNELSLVNPLNRVEMLQAAAIHIAKGEERLNRDGIVTRVRNSNSTMALEKLLRGLKEEVEAIQGTEGADLTDLVVEIVSYEETLANEAGDSST